MQNWFGAVSPDGRWMWDGSRWVPFTHRHPRSHWPKIVVALAALVGLGFAGLAAADLWALHMGCGSVDPTDPNNYSTVSIQDDTYDVVVVSDCRGAYCYVNRVTLVPGKAAVVNAACAASGGDMTSWRVSTTNGRTIGYIAVDTPRKHDGLVYPVPHASSTRLVATRPSG
jgi:hypothetical protein